MNKRTLILGVAAFLLVAVTIYDYTAGPDQPRHSPATGSRLSPKQETSPSRIGGLIREASELKYLLGHAPEIRGRYQAIAVPYAEAVASFVTLYNPGESPQAVARSRLAALVPAGVNLSGLLVSEGASTDRGAVSLTATLSFASNDSAAFETAILALGDPANGMVWKELNIGSDSENRTLQASGKLLMLMVEQSE